MVSRLTGHMRHNVVAYLALFFALSGTAIAARPLITGADVQNESLTGADVQNESLKGADVDESSLVASSLGKVGDAEKLDGNDSRVFLRGVAGHVSEIGEPIGIAGDDPYGFQSFRQGLGTYSIALPPGTLSCSGNPVIVVTPERKDRLAHVSGWACGPQGHAFGDVQITDKSGDPQDGTFRFIFTGPA